MNLGALYVYNHARTITISTFTTTLGGINLFDASDTVDDIAPLLPRIKGGARPPLLQSHLYYQAMKTNLVSRHANQIFSLMRNSHFQPGKKRQPG
jgi:hypothetical protein